MFAHLIVLASVWVTRKRGNSSLVTGTQISDNQVETPGNGTERHPVDKDDDDGEQPEDVNTGMKPPT